ncbi:hypothetical protein ILYODFUR_014446, partial [Ilyodon furcidens]
ELQKLMRPWRRRLIVYSAEWLLPAEPCPGFTFEVLPHSLLAASSLITRPCSVSCQAGKYFNEFTAAQGSPWIHRIRLQNNSMPCLSTLWRRSPTGGARSHGVPICQPQLLWFAHFSQLQPIHQNCH